jgi:hypothetical protein
LPANSTTSARRFEIVYFGFAEANGRFEGSGHVPLCGVGSSPVARVLLALGVQPPDACVDLGALVFVDPPGWDPLRQIISVQPAGPAFLQEMGVVVSAEQRQVL